MTQQIARSLEAQLVVAMKEEEAFVPLTNFELEAIAGGAVICNDD